MADTFEIAPKMVLPKELQHLRVAAYCRVSTEQEEQDSSLELQELRYTCWINENPNWENAGIFSEKASGLNAEDRAMFRTMIRHCKKGDIDLILTKSISRFGRNTLEMLKALRALNDLGVDVYFEKENLWLHSQHMQMLLTIHCAFAQAESENMSLNIRWGVKQGFRNGTSGYAGAVDKSLVRRPDESFFVIDHKKPRQDIQYWLRFLSPLPKNPQPGHPNRLCQQPHAEFVCYGYKQANDGKLAIDEPDAKIVRTIFEMRANGKSLGAISNWLYENKVLSPTGRKRWSRETISKLLKNEKYVGDVMLQKTFVKDLFSRKQVKNNGERERFLIQEHHPAIISRTLFEKVNG